jgi:hypothetical protein
VLFQRKRRNRNLTDVPGGDTVPTSFGRTNAASHHGSIQQEKQKIDALIVYIILAYTSFWAA